MGEYRPEPTELWQTLKRHRRLIRRIALAIALGTLAYGLGEALGGQGDARYAMGIGGAILGFFVLPFANRGDGTGSRPPDDAE